MNWFVLIVWIMIGGTAAYIDITTSSFLFIWFTVGAIIAIIILFLGYGLIVQVVAFVVVSAICVAIGYPIVKKTIKKTVKITPTMEQNYIGKEFIIEKDVNEKATIKYEGIYWTVKNTGDKISKGTKVKIIGIEGNKLLISK